MATRDPGERPFSIHSKIIYKQCISNAIAFLCLNCSLSWFGSWCSKKVWTTKKWYFTLVSYTGWTTRIVATITEKDFEEKILYKSGPLSRSPHKESTMFSLHFHLYLSAMTMVKNLKNIFLLLALSLLQISVSFFFQWTVQLCGVCI